MAMAEQFVVYYDSGTSNSRIYLLDDQFQVRYTERVNVGSKDTSITGSNLKLLQGLKRLYDGMLSATGISESQVTGIYASGMITSPLWTAGGAAQGHSHFGRGDGGFHRLLL